MVAQGVFTTGLLHHYCTVEEVLAVLRSHDLQQHISDDELQLRVKDLLPVSRQLAENTAGRDFFRHCHDLLIIDGTGHSHLNLQSEAGIAPPVHVHTLRINGKTVPADAYTVYPDSGIIRLQRTSARPVFPPGQHNVEAECDWGFATPPADVALAQAKLTAAEVLRELGRACEGISRERLGDYSVAYSTSGSFVDAASQLAGEAREVLVKYKRARHHVV